MKPSVLITGGNSGVGLEIAEYFAPHSLSLSRSNGFDIGSIEARKKIVERSLEFDIFVNHAHNGHIDGQTTLLYEVVQAWEVASKKGYIFNTGSIVLAQAQKEFKRYAVIKKALEVASDQCCKKIENGLCSFRMTLINPGMLDTEAVRQKSHWEGNGVRGSDMARLIESLYNGPSDLLISKINMSAIQKK